MTYPGYFAPSADSSFACQPGKSPVPPLQPHACNTADDSAVRQCDMPAGKHGTTNDHGEHVQQVFALQGGCVEIQADEAHKWGAALMPSTVQQPGAEPPRSIAATPVHAAGSSLLDPCCGVSMAHCSGALAASHCQCCLPSLPVRHWYLVRCILNLQCVAAMWQQTFHDFVLFLGPVRLMQGRAHPASLQLAFHIYSADTFSNQPKILWATSRHELPQPIIQTADDHQGRKLQP